MRRKIFLVYLALACLCLLTACGQTQEEPEEARDLITIGFSQVGAESDWRVANTESILSTFTEENGYELIYSDAQQKQENQIMAIRRFILQKVDYILLAPVTETGWDSVLLEAKAAGIPVILVDRSVTVEDDSLYTACVGSDFYAEGETAMDWLEKHLEDQGRSEEPVNIIHVYGTEGSTAQIGRTRALMDAIEQHENWNLTAQINGNFTRAKGYESMKELLKTTTDVDVVYCENDNSALGILQAMEEAGIDTVDGEATIVAFDATNYGLTACLEGKINLDVECNPLQGPKIQSVIQQLEAGETPEKTLYLDYSWFDSEHITQSIIDMRAY